MCHGEAFAPALGAAHEVQFLRLDAVGALNHSHGGIAHLLVRGMGEIDEGLIVAGEQLRRLSRLRLMAVIPAIVYRLLKWRIAAGAFLG
jgi:hypothetical protein